MLADLGHDEVEIYEAGNDGQWGTLLQQHEPVDEMHKVVLVLGHQA